jgi:hypothetical protein
MESPDPNSQLRSRVECLQGNSSAWTTHRKYVKWLLPDQTIGEFTGPTENICHVTATLWSVISSMRMLHADRENTAAVSLAMCALRALLSHRLTSRITFSWLLSFWLCRSSGIVQNTKEEYRTTEKVQKPSNPEYHTSSSETFRICGRWLSSSPNFVPFSQQERYSSDFGGSVETRST